jgi:uncharacterized membrane protein
VKSFIRYLISISVVAPIALAAVGVSVGIAGPLQNRKFIHKGIESLPEWATPGKENFGSDRAGV